MLAEIRRRVTSVTSTRAGIRTRTLSLTMRIHVWHAGHVQAGHGVGMIPSFSARVLRMNSKHSYKLLKKFDILATDVDSTK